MESSPVVVRDLSLVVVVVVVVVVKRAALPGKMLLLETKLDEGWRQCNERWASVARFGDAQSAKRSDRRTDDETKKTQGC